jgi:hypothetical protein
MALAGIGEALAELIIQARPFATLEELLSIPGIGSSTLERLKAQGLVVGQLPQQHHAVPSFSADAALYSTTQRYRAMTRYMRYGLSQKRKSWSL